MESTSIRCVACGRPVEATDDRVVCPLCGAPYHRGCYPREGCRFADRHAVGWIWRPPLGRRDEEAVVCGNCGTIHDRGTVRCHHCGGELETAVTPLPPEVDPSVFYADFSPYIGIAPDSLLDGNLALDTALYLGPRAGYYLAQFFRLSLRHSSFSWNWMAALFPLEWALARKQKRLFLGLMACWLPMAVLSMVALFWALPGLDAVSLFAMLAGGQTGEMAFGPWLLWQLAAFGRWCMRLYMATRANHHYRRHTTMAIRAIPPGSESVRRAALRRAGGLSLPAVALFYGVCGVLFALGLVICGKM